MSGQNAKIIYGLLKRSLDNLAQDEKQLVNEWLLSFQFFEPFRDEPEIMKLVSFLEPIKLQSGQIIAYEDGVELCYIVSGALYLDSEEQTPESIKKKNKKDAMQPKDWIIRPNAGKACYIATKDPDTQIIIINAKKNRKYINKKLTSKWGDLVKIIHRQPLFKYLDKDTLLDIAQTAKISNHPYNSVVYSKGEQALYSYILLQGTIKILSGYTQVSCLSPQQIFGDEQILGGKTHRQFKAVCSSQKVKLLRIQKCQIQKSLAVLTVLGKQRSVQKYVSSKNEYRNAISTNIRRYFEASKQKQYPIKQATKDSLPLYKYKKQTSGQYSLTLNQDPENKFISSKFMETLRLNRRRNSIRSRDVSQSPSDQVLTQRKSLQATPKSRKFQYFKLPQLNKQ